MSGDTPDTSNDSWEETRRAWFQEMTKLGIERFDQAHEHLMDLILDVNRTLATFSLEQAEDEGWLALLSLAKQLEIYGRGLFASEEESMREENYPDLHRHKRAHLQLVGELTRFRQRAAEADLAYCRSSAPALKIDLFDHIQQLDVAYVPFFRRRQRPHLGPYA
ncbi:MAG: hemerythrin domain-containing protein [Magnetococcales bacterium]|nr:hemerythrin domain-containing protein [Magnetococcales bacterium]